jgi:1,4-dihydroxy-2-naphthoate octaprenyltransferase
VDADRSIGRRHIAILFGRRTASLVYNLFLLLAYLTIILGVVFRVLPPLSLIGLLTILIAIPTGLRAFRHADDIPQLIPAMGMNVLVNLLTPLLMGIGLLIQ